MVTKNSEGLSPICMSTIRSEIATKNSGRTSGSMTKPVIGFLAKKS